MLIDQPINSIFLPYKHLSLKKGKGIRSKLVMAFYKWYNVKEEDKFLHEYKELVEILQNASLMIDDIEDGSSKRRGLPCSHLVYGLPATINSANYYYFVVLKKILEICPKDKVEQIMASFIESILLLHEGQGMEIQFRENLIVPTIEEYKKIVDLKTSTFFKAIYKPMKIISGIDMNLDRILKMHTTDYDMKMLVIDYLQKAGSFEYTEAYLEQLKQDILDEMNNFDENPILSILKMHTTDYDMKMLVIDYLQKAGSFEYTEAYLEQLKQDILDEMNNFDENPIFEEVVQSIFLKKE